MPRASGPVPFELGVCAGHVVRIGLRTQNDRKSQGKRTDDDKAKKNAKSEGKRKGWVQRAEINRKSQGKRTDDDEAKKCEVKGLVQ